jgi:hypothetical protein
MKTIKRKIAIILCLFILSAGFIYAAGTPVSAYLTPDVTIMVGDQVKSFYDANGKPVFPLIYQGTTYIPVRAVAALMGENIEWDAKSKTIYIGRTLSMPGSADVTSSSVVRDGDIPATLKPPVQIVNARSMQEIIVMYNFEIQHFSDVNGKTVYPVNYQGSNYLPIRAVSKLMGETIEWEQGLKLITISATAKQPSAGDDKVVNKLKGFLSDVVNTFDKTTASIINLQNKLSDAELAALAASANNNVRTIDKLLAEVKLYEMTAFSAGQKEAYDKLLAYTEAASYYILIIENIIYMASQGQDYTIFAETLLTFAMDSQAKYELVRDALKDL